MQIHYVLIESEKKENVVIHGTQPITLGHSAGKESGWCMRGRPFPICRHGRQGCCPVKPLKL